MIAARRPAMHASIACLAAAPPHPAPRALHPAPWAPAPCRFASGAWGFADKAEQVRLVQAGLLAKVKTFALTSPMQTHMASRLMIQIDAVWDRCAAARSACVCACACVSVRARVQCHR